LPGRWQYHDTDAACDVRLMPDFSPQTTAKYPRNQNQGQPDNDEIKVNAVIRDGFIQKIKHGLQSFACIQVHIASLVYAFRILITGSTI
jgi:hypothetical protein